MLANHSHLQSILCPSPSRRTPIFTARDKRIALNLVGRHHGRLLVATLHRSTSALAKSWNPAKRGVGVGGMNEYYNLLDSIHRPLMRLCTWSHRSFYPFRRIWHRYALRAPPVPISPQSFLHNLYFYTWAPFSPHHRNVIASPRLPRTFSFGFLLLSTCLKTATVSTVAASSTEDCSTRKSVLPYLCHV